MAGLMPVLMLCGCVAGTAFAALRVTPGTRVFRFIRRALSGSAAIFMLSLCGVPVCVNMWTVCASGALGAPGVAAAAALALLGR